MKKPTEKPKMYVVRKYIKATNLKQALKMEPKTEVHDAWIDNEWRDHHLPSAIGFQLNLLENEE